MSAAPPIMPAMLSLSASEMSPATRKGTPAAVAVATLIRAEQAWAKRPPGP